MFVANLTGQELDTLMNAVKKLKGHGINASTRDNDLVIRTLGKEDKLLMFYSPCGFRNATELVYQVVSDLLKAQMVPARIKTTADGSCLPA